MATIGKFFTRFSIFLYCGVGFLFVSLRHILVNGYSHRAGFMVMLGLAFMAAAITDKKKKTTSGLAGRRGKKVKRKETGEKSLERSGQ